MNVHCNRSVLLEIAFNSPDVHPPGMVQELTRDDFEREVLHSPLPVMVDFWAEWCGPCKMLAPVFEELGQEFIGKLKFTKISVENYPEIAAANQVAGIPCLILFHRGKEVDRIIGFSPKPRLKQKIDSILGKI